MWLDDENPGLTHAIIIILTLSDFDINESRNTSVSLEVRKGTCFSSFVFFTSKARIHSFKANRLLLISAPSARRCRSLDCVSAFNPQIIVHECKYKIDGFTKYIEDQNFIFDNVFNENNTTEDIFKYTIQPAIDLVFNKGTITCFAYGQTGSGKTFTMKGIEDTAIDNIFNIIKKQDKKLTVFLSFFEIYGGRLFDLLNDKNKLSVLEDSHQKIQIFGLEEIMVESPEQMREFINLANSVRTTHNTVTNATSSRSHAICNVIIKIKIFNFTCLDSIKRK